MSATRRTARNDSSTRDMTEIAVLQRKEYKAPETVIHPLSPEAFEYLTTTRKLRPDVLAAYRVGMNDRGEIAIPFFDEKERRTLVKFRHATGQKLTRRYRDDDGEWREKQAKSFIEAKGKPVLLGSHLCDPKEGALVICFGDYDAMAVAQCGIPNAVSLPFGDKGLDWVDYQWQFLESFAEIILVPDNDHFESAEAEQKAFSSLDKLATRLGKHKVRLAERGMYGEAKDANEIYIKYGEERLTQIVNEADWFPSGIVDVADYVDSEQIDGVPIGLKDIDRATGGFSGGQLIIMSGDNGAGKTTIVLNMAAHFIAHDHKVFIWSGEQGVGKIRYWFERIAAGPNNLKRVTSRTTGYDRYFPCDDVIEFVRAWYRGYLFQLTEVNLTPEEFFKAAELAVRRHGCELVIVDNLMAFTGGEGDGYYQAQGDFAQSCKRFAEKWNVPVLLICHNKKLSETSRLRIPTKDDIEGSKKITNWADVVIQMWRVPDTNKTEFENADTIFRLCKTRESGMFEDVRLVFDAESARFAQMTAEWEQSNQRYMGWEQYAKV